MVLSLNDKTRISIRVSENKHYSESNNSEDNALNGNEEMKPGKDIGHSMITLKYAEYTEG